MFGLTRWDPIEEIFNFQREVDRLFDRFWSDLPSRTSFSSSSFQVNTTDEGWRIEVPLPGVAPEHINLEVTGNTLSIKAEQPGDKDRGARKYEQTMTVPQFLDVEKLTATHEHGMLRLNIPLKESVKPRRIQIETTGGEQRQLAAAASAA
ncbi:MAG TPA: Hsp20/alpha crystallin family protein [Vicinamibacterales bacterium]